MLPLLADCADGLIRSDMAERYYFRLRGTNEVVEDTEGIMATSIETAVAEATQIISEMQMRSELPDSDECWRIEIHNADGDVLRSLQLY